MLTAIVDSLLSSELEVLVQALRRDGIRCLPSDTPLEELHGHLSSYANEPIVIYGVTTLEMPYDDCQRLWLCCGPEIQYDEQHASWFLGKPLEEKDVHRKEKAISYGYKLVSHIDALSFMANVLATNCVKSMHLGNKAKDIVLRHVTKQEFCNED